MEKEYYWQDMVSGLVTKTAVARKPSRLHKRITKAAYESVKAPNTGLQSDGAGMPPEFHQKNICGCYHCVKWREQNRPAAKANR